MFWKTDLHISCLKNNAKIIKKKHFSSRILIRASLKIKTIVPFIFLQDKELSTFSGPRKYL